MGLAVGAWRFSPAPRGYVHFQHAGTWHGKGPTCDCALHPFLLPCLPFEVQLPVPVPVIWPCFSFSSSSLRIILMADTPLLYGNYSTQMYPIIPDGESTVSHDTLGKDKINPNKIFEQFKKILD